jgi:hypothetical protein
MFPPKTIVHDIQQACCKFELVQELAWKELESELEKEPE